MQFKNLSSNIRYVYEIPLFSKAMEKVRNISTKICDDIPPCYSTNYAQLEMATKKYADLFEKGEFDVSIQFRETFVETINMQSKSLYKSRAENHLYMNE